MAKISPKPASFPIQPPWWPELVATVHEAREATNASGAAIALTKASSSRIVCYARSGTMAPEPGATMLVEDSLTAQCIRSGRQLHSHDAETDARICAAAAVELSARSLVVTPIQQQNQVIGVLAVFSGAPNAFSPMHLATLKTTADKIAGILQEKTAPVAGQGSIQLLKKETDGPPLDASKPKPPISTRLPLSGKEVRRETQSESRVTPVIEQPAEPLPATPTASAHSFATFDALAVQKKESAATSLVLIGTAALLIIVGSATWAYWKRTAPPAVDAVTSVQPAQPATPTAEVVAQPAEPAPQIEVPAQRLNRTAIERANATSQLPAGPTRSAKPLEVAPSKSTATLSATKEPTPLPSAADVATPGSNSTQPLQQFALVGANSMTPPQTPPPDLVLAPKQTPILQSDVVPARVVRSVPPQYPPFAKQKGATGTVVVQAKVAKNGSLTDLKFLSGPPIFRQAALDAVKLWQYKPATLNGQVFEQEVDIKLEFRPNSR